MDAMKTAWSITGFGALAALAVAGWMHQPRSVAAFNQPSAAIEHGTTFAQAPELRPASVQFIPAVNTGGAVRYQNVEHRRYDNGYYRNGGYDHYNDNDADDNGYYRDNRYNRDGNYTQDDRYYKRDDRYRNGDRYGYRNRSGYGYRNSSAYGNDPYYRNDGYGYYGQRPWTHSAAIIGGGAAAGAAIGGLSGGRKGAGIGALVGGAGGLIYDRMTHKNPGKF